MPLPLDYPALLARLDDWHGAARTTHPGVMPCRAGCHACCHGPFDISVADALLVRDSVRALPPEDRAAVHRRAEAQLARMGQLEPAFAAPWDVSGLGERRVDALLEAFNREPCPALDESGGCRIYQGRPMVCRLMGLGLRTPAGEVIPNACPIQNDHPAYRSLEPQVFDLDAWNVEEEPLLARAAVQLFGTVERRDFETTVAGAVLLDRP